MTREKTDAQFLLDIAKRSDISKEEANRIIDIAYRLPTEKPPILIGTKIWRMVETNGYPDSVSLAIMGYTTGPVNRAEGLGIGFNFEPDKKGGVMFRASQGAYSFYKRNLWVATGSTGRGLVCISKEPPPSDWTYFEVTGLSKKQNVAFVKAVAGPGEELVAQYSPQGAKFKNANPKEAA